MKIHIKSCTDGMLWYANHIGESYTLLRNLPSEKCWLVRASDGYSNIVHYKDGVMTDEYNVIVDESYQSD